MNTCHGLRARHSSRSNSSGVRLIVLAVAGDDVAGHVDGQVADLQGLGAGASKRRTRARIRATSSLGLNGFTT